MHSFEYKETRFLNVDLDLFSRSDLQPLVTAMEPNIFVLHVGREKRTFSAHLELSRMPKTPDAAIRAYGALITNLPGTERKLWDTAKVRDFNIGVQTAMLPRAYEISLNAESLEIVSNLGARIVFTIYAPK